MVDDKSKMRTMYRRCVDERSRVDLLDGTIAKVRTVDYVDYLVIMSRGPLT